MFVEAVPELVVVVTGRGILLFGLKFVLTSLRESDRVISKLLSL